MMVILALYAIPVLLGAVCIALAIFGCVEYELFVAGDDHV